MGRKFGRTVSNMGIRQKLLCAYSLFAVLPMLLITGYTYISTKKILVDQVHEHLTQQIAQEVKGIDEKTEQFRYVSDSLFMDSMLYEYLTVDYSDRGFEELCYYVESLLSRIRLLYPEIDRLAFYSTNDTLPRDQRYFYLLSPEEAQQWDRYAGAKGDAFQAVCLEEGYFSFIRRLNLYESGKYELFLRMDIGREVLADTLQQTDTLRSILRDPYGEPLVMPDAEETILAMQADPDWFSLSQDTQYCGTLTNLVNIRLQQREASAAASRVIMVFVAASAMATAAIYFYGRSFTGNVTQIIAGARRIGAGDFAGRIPVNSSDELGQLAGEINRLGGQLQELISNSYLKEIARRDSELNLLQEQINPHFLYNALSSISSMARKNRDADTCEAIRYLADFYRISLNNGKKILTVREEIRLLESYLAVQRIRFGDSICVDYDLDEGLLEQKTIKLILQPVVENAIHHGRYDDREDFHISIRLRAQDGRMVFTVSDDGKGIEPERLLRLQESMDGTRDGVGLINVNARIRLQYGPQYGVYLESQPYLGTIVRLSLPLETEEGPEK